MRLLAWELVSGFLMSVIVVWWPSSWQYIPGVVFGAVIAIYFSKEVWAEHRNKVIGFLDMACFILFSCFAYFIALIEAEWVLGTNGFATFDSYGTPSALPALFVGCFVAGCIGSFIIAVGMRLFLFRFDLVRGLFLFSIFCGTLGSVIAFGFETFGFIPQFLFPLWQLGLAGVVLYLRRVGSRPENKEMRDLRGAVLS